MNDVQYSLITHAVTGAAIIGNAVVPASEMKVYLALKKLQGKASMLQLVPALSEYNWKAATISSLLHRLCNKRKLINKQAIYFIINGTKIKRIVWSIKLPIIQENVK